MVGWSKACHLTPFALLTSIRLSHPFGPFPLPCFAQTSASPRLSWCLPKTASYLFCFRNCVGCVSDAKLQYDWILAPSLAKRVRAEKRSGVLEHLMCVFGTYLLLSWDGAEVLCIYLHTGTENLPQARYVKQKLIISDNSLANALSLRHSNAWTEPPRQFHWIPSTNVRPRRRICSQVAQPPSQPMWWRTWRVSLLYEEHEI